MSSSPPIVPAPRGFAALRAAVAPHVEALEQLEREACARREALPGELESVKATFADAGCVVEDLPENSDGGPLGEVRSGWIARFPGTALYVAFWVRGHDGASPSALADPHSRRAYSLRPAFRPPCASAPERRELCAAGLFEEIQPLERSDLSLVIDRGERTIVLERALRLPPGPVREPVDSLSEEADRLAGCLAGRLSASPL